MSETITQKCIIKYKYKLNFLNFRLKFTNKCILYCGLRLTCTAIQWLRKDTRNIDQQYIPFS